MRLNRADPVLNDAVEALDVRLRDAKRKIPKATIEEQKELAWSMFSPAELEFVSGEIDRCVRDRRYYLQNYHVIQPENGQLMCLYPLREHQEIVEQALDKSIEETGEAWLLILKFRQAGITEWADGVMCWRTFFLPNAYTISVAQDPELAGWIQRKAVLAYTHLPWWLQSEQLYMRSGTYLEFGRKDAARKSADPGLGSIMLTTHAQRGSGIAIGRTCRSLHMSETSRWAGGEAYTGDIRPTMNADDTVAICESTAYGEEGFFYNLCKAAMERDSESDWKLVFLPAYRAVKRCFLKIKPQQMPFLLTEAEQQFTEKIKKEENFIIKPEFWNWRRRRIKESINDTGFPYAHYESFPITPQEAFQSSGSGAFPRHKLDEQQLKNVIPPVWYGEIGYGGRDMPPLRNLALRQEGQALEKREFYNRFYLWEEPDPTQSYYAAVDVGAGKAGDDFSVIEVFRAGLGAAPDVQVAEWVGWEPPISFAKIVYGVVWWFNRCEVAIEYAKEGQTTANYLKNDLKYPSYYRPRRYDRPGVQFSPYFHWQTTGKTKPLLMDVTTQALLDDSVVIRSQYLLDEMRRAVREGLSFAGLGGHDDAAMAGTICIYCLRETLASMKAGPGEGDSSQQMHLRRPGSARPGTVTYGVYNEFFQQVTMTQDLNKAEAIVQDHPNWQVKPIMATKANTRWSPIYHGGGIERELYDFGMADRDITPDVVTEYSIEKRYGMADDDDRNLFGGLS